MYKVMLVEDENILRKGIEVLTDWASLNCSVVFGASNGIEALKYAASNPIDILITDIRMPGMDGLELIKRLKELNSNISVIILSAYGEFSYAQRALALEVKQYVLKTNYRENLPIAIKATIKEIEMRDDIKINFESLFLKTTEQSEIDSYFELNLDKDEPYYILSIETLNNNENSNFKKFIEYAYKSLSPKITKRFDSLYILLVSTKKEESNRIEIIKQMSEQFITSCTTLVEMKINIGISGEYRKSIDFKKAYFESLSNLGRIFDENSYSITEANDDDGKPSSLVDCSLYAKKIIDGYISSNIEDLKLINDDFFDEFKTKNYDIDHETNQVGVLFSLIGTSFQERSIKIDDFLKVSDELSELMKNCYSSYSLKKSVMETHLILLKLFSVYMNNSISLKVNTYIENNYMNPISIEDISESLHLSSNYVGRQYKKETGKNVLQYLNEYRVERAKHLLKEGRLQISEITFQVGYSNPAYFSNVFSKITGVSPKKFVQN